MFRSKRSRIFAVILLAAGAIGLFAQTPIVDIDKGRHGNLWAAQKDIAAAYEKIEAAQNANNYRLGGHAGKARELLAQASRELSLAADTADKR